MTDSYLYNGQGPDDHVASCPDCSAVIALIERRGEEVAPPPSARSAPVEQTPAVSPETKPNDQPTTGMRPETAPAGTTQPEPSATETPAAESSTTTPPSAATR